MYTVRGLLSKADFRKDINMMVFAFRLSLLMGHFLVDSCPLRILLVI